MDFVRAFDERPNACAVPIQTLISPAKIESIDPEVYVWKQSRHKTGFFISLLRLGPVGPASNLLCIPTWLSTRTLVTSVSGVMCSRICLKLVVTWSMQGCITCGPGLERAGGKP